MTRALTESMTPKNKGHLSYPANRQAAFKQCRKALKEHIWAESDRFIVVQGDSLELLAKLPPALIGLILTDPPYHSTQKHNITNDKQFKHDHEYLAWISRYGDQWKRVLRPNGSLYTFCSMKLAAHIEVSLTDRFNCLSHITWSKPNLPGFDGWKGKMKKTALRAWYPHSERILFFEPCDNGNLKRSTFGTFLRSERKRVGLSSNEVAEITESYGKVNHGGAVSNWETGRNVPSREQYRRIIEAFSARDPDAIWPAYEDVIRPFHAHADMQYTDVWDYYSVRPYKGKHPAEKPLDMLEAMIAASSYDEDIVLDCFGGSGSTGVAALRQGRRAIVMELEEKWCEHAAASLAQALPAAEEARSLRRSEGTLDLF